ncbi:MAG: hypothetical protein C0601_09045 [Candidatus Muiribacterium halophilum]|uniref:Membrane protein insertase YidC n=1 Tax=Muiribacterium halophilum TaxID=2053465 RepID=A0A2N5ZDX0_MUIH1|nr:MAG: hypothetical protein C0601_09045 [Candidatus Muirbacterium halophilum]
MNKKLFLSIFFFILLMVNQIGYAQDIELLRGNMTVFFDSERPVIKEAIIKTEYTQDVVAKNLEFLILTSDKKDIREALEKGVYELSLNDQILKIKFNSDVLDLSGEMTFNEDNDFTYDMNFSSKEKVNLRDIQLVVKPGLTHEKNGFIERAIYYLQEEKAEKFKFKSKPMSEDVSKAKWVAMTNKYYTFALFNNDFSKVVVADTETIKTVIDDAGKEEEKKLYNQQITFNLEDRSINKDEDYQLTIKGYLGEKKLEKLERKGLGKVLDLGFFGAFARLLLLGLKKLNDFTRNWGLSIALLTVIIRLILYPLNFKQAKSMAEMQKIQPEMEAIKKKYKDDSQKMNQEVMALYKKHNINPMGGCFPILIQIPILFSLFTMLRTSIEIKGASFLWLGDLSKPDSMYIMPVLIAVSMYFQQKATASNDPRQKQMMIMMPLIMLMITTSLPSGVLIYWFVSNIAAFLQQVYVKKHLDKQEAVKK